MTLRRLCVFIVLSVLLVVGCVEVDGVPAPATGRSPVLQGRLTDQSPEVGQLFTTVRCTQTNEAGLLECGTGATKSVEDGAEVLLEEIGCTATLTGRGGALITAAHCVGYESRKSRPHDHIEFDTPLGRDAAALAECASFGTGVGADDVAICRLTGRVPPEIAQPRPFAPSEPNKGDPVHTFGYGGLNPGLRPEELGKRRFSGFLWGPTIIVQNGDSGGPLLDSSSRIFAVISGGFVKETFDQNVNAEDWTSGGDSFGMIPPKRREIDALLCEWNEGDCAPAEATRGSSSLARSGPPEFELTAATGLGGAMLNADSTSSDPPVGGNDMGVPVSGTLGFRFNWFQFGITGGYYGAVDACEYPTCASSIGMVGPFVSAHVGDYDRRFEFVFRAAAAYLDVVSNDFKHVERGQVNGEPQAGPSGDLPGGPSADHDAIAGVAGLEMRFAAGLFWLGPTLDLLFLYSGDAVGDEHGGVSGVTVLGGGRLGFHVPL